MGKFGKALVPLQNFIPRADEMRDTFGVTDLYSTGIYGLDAYLGGGYGRKNGGYEMILIYGPTGSFKSVTGLNMIIDPIKKGVRTGLMILEDDPADVLNRLRMMTDGSIDKQPNVFFLDDNGDGYTLQEALRAIEDWFQICDVIFLDHLEYLFAGAEGETERDLYNKQAIWMRHLNTLMKKTGKTIIMVQHTNKSQAEGMDKIKGSGAFAQTCSKVIEVKRNNVGNVCVNLVKTRFTPYRGTWYEMGVEKFRLKDLPQ